jgi:lipoprotein-anchoring transpeptidase ErfK/SrfK
MRSMRLALFLAATLAAAVPAANAGVLITIDKSAQRMTVAVDGATRWSWPVSTGRRGYATPSGSYTAFRMEKDHFSKEWDDAPMPHSIFFTKQGHAIHGSYETKRLGTAASHGCVRLHPAHAAQLYALVERRGVSSATVVVTGGETARR